MPLKGGKNGGTNADGSKSRMYCLKCYQNGAFTRPDVTAAEMQVLVKDRLKEMHFPGFLAEWFSKGIPKLERWKNIANS